MQSIYNEEYSTSDLMSALAYSDIRDDSIPALPAKSRKKLNITYVEAPCGAGKTYALVKTVAARSKASTLEEPVRIMIVAPSKKLLKQIKGDLDAEGTVGTHIIHSANRLNRNNAGRTVQSRVIEYLTHENRQCYASILLITHKTFMALPFIPNIEEWSIYIDEVPQIEFFENPEIPISRGLFQKYLSAGECHGTLIEIKEREGANLKALLDTNDSGIKPFRDLFFKVLSSKWEVLVPIKQFEQLLDSGEDDPNNNYKLPLITLAKPELFENCCFLAADFRKNLIYNRLIQCGVIPKENAELSIALRYHRYPASVGRRIRILYCLEDRRYSLTNSDDPTMNGKSIKEEMDEVILFAVGGSTFLLVKNNVDDGELARHQNAIVLEGIPSGLNCYSEYTTLVFSAALNRNPQHISYLKAAGLDQKCIDHSILIDRAHQAAMRTNLRVPSSSQVVTIVVTDKYVAQELAAILGCDDIQRIGDITFAPKANPDQLPNYTDAERKKRSGFLKLMREVTQANSQESLVQQNASLREHFSLKNREECTLENANSLHHEAAIAYTLFTQPDAYKKSEFRTKSCGVAAFVKFLEQAATTPQEDKDDVWLFSMAVYQEFTQDSSFRSYDNFFYSTALVLDFDSGDAAPEQVEEIIWPSDEARRRERCSYLICNSYSNSPERPNRFRLIIPFKTPVRSVGLHKFICQEIVNRLTLAGLPPSTSGLDPKSKSPVQPFRLPCTNRKHPDHAFFRHKGMTARTFMSWSLDPQRWERVMPVDAELLGHEPKKQENTDRPPNKSPAVMAEAERHSQYIKALRQDRRQPIYDLALYLANNHWSLSDIKTYLGGIAGRNRNMKRHVESAMDFIKRYRDGQEPTAFRF